MRSRLVPILRLCQTNKKLKKLLRTMSDEPGMIERYRLRYHKLDKAVKELLRFGRLEILNSLFFDIS